jgi:methionine-rich copper-binding protein CopC
MAQIVKLRRSAVTGRKPTNAQLELGELSINTTDGKVFLAKSGSLGPSIEEIITTNSVNTGSLNIVGAVTASQFSGSFNGDGTNILNVVSSSYAVTSSYASYAFTIASAPGTTQKMEVSVEESTWTFNHNIGEQFPNIQVFDYDGNVVIPSRIYAQDLNTAIIDFTYPQRGYVVATVGGGIPAIDPSLNGRIFATDGTSGYWATKTQAGVAGLTSNTYTGNQTITGSINVTETIKLTPQNPLPTGQVGMLATSGSNLFFHNGSTWQQIN